LKRLSLTPSWSKLPPSKISILLITKPSYSWWQKAKLLQFVDSQEELNRYEGYLNKEANKWLEYYWSSRKFLFLSRWALYWQTFSWHFRFGFEFKFWLPGIEVKYACEAAEKTGAKLEFLGAELNHVTTERLYHETRMNVPHYFWKRLQYTQSPYTEENASNRQKIAQSGPKAFTEKCLDQHLINWYIASTEIFFPKLKEIFVDKRNEDLFKDIDQSSGQKIVVLVNQWHLEGIEHHWCSRYGQLPRSVAFEEPINPIGDMNLREGLFQRLYNYVGREIASSYTRGSPATYADWIIGYHRESNWQYEHRDM
jgi:hypothetical protein